ncbi:lebercilin-like protein [Latimeria chalumnae]|uniref:lebercilin-like protein n=1 Tax=Latimeria chalumnae TaxID=7897 RepID=UPI00313A9797
MERFYYELQSTDMKISVPKIKTIVQSPAEYVIQLNGESLKQISQIRSENSMNSSHSTPCVGSGGGNNSVISVESRNTSGSFTHSRRTCDMPRSYNSGSHKPGKDSSYTNYSEDFHSEESLKSFRVTDSIGKAGTLVRKSLYAKQNSFFPIHQVKAKRNPTYKKLQNANTSLISRQSLSVTQKNLISNGQNAVVQRILSAKAHRIKQLGSEVSDLQQRLEEAVLENKLLKRLQYRHVKALGKFEDVAGDLPLLIAKHNNEVRTLRDLLRKARERDRSMSRKLKETEVQLLSTKDNLQQLQKLSEDKNLAEREKLIQQLSDVTEKLVINCKRIQEKERELDIKNIYTNRILKASKKQSTSIQLRGEGKHKAIQTDLCVKSINSKSHPVEQNINKQTKETEAGSVRYEKVVEDKYKEEKGEPKPRTAKELKSAEEDWKEMKEEQQLLEEMEQGKQEQEREAQLLRAELEQEEQEKQTQLPEEIRKIKETERMEQEAKETEGEKDRRTKGNFQENKADNKRITSQGLKYTPTDNSRKLRNRPRRHYAFTDAVENLHQGLPVRGGSSSFPGHIQGSSTATSREFVLSKEFLTSEYEPSFGKSAARISHPRQMGDGPEERGKESPKSKKKSSLLEELFGPNPTSKDIPERPPIRSFNSREGNSRENKSTHKNSPPNIKSHLNLVEMVLTRTLEETSDEAE